MRLSIRHLRKVYQDGKVALDDFNMDLDHGVFGLLGPNGAGKSTLLEILSLNLMPTAGRIEWEGRDIHRHPREFRQMLGYLPQTYGFYGELKVQQFLEYMGRLCGLRGKALQLRVDEVLALVNLEGIRKRRIKGLSGGMRQRLAISQALVHAPQLLVIDEPTTGLDPGERVAFRNMLFDLGQTCIIFLSTHIVKDVEFSCHGMTILYGGRQHFTGAPIDFMHRVDGRVFETTMPFEAFEAFARSHHVVSIHEHGGDIDVRFISPATGTDVPHAQPSPINLEDTYVDFIRQRREAESQLGGAAAEPISIADNADAVEELLHG